MSKIGNVIILHGCSSSIIEDQRIYSKHWHPWIEAKVKELHIVVERPVMPSPSKPIYQSWKKQFDTLYVDDQSILIGHSCGAAFLVRWLSETKKKIAKLILIAPAKIPALSSNQELIDFYDFEIDTDIPNRVKKIFIFSSSNEEQRHRESQINIYYKILGGQLFDLPNHGHYTQGAMRTVEFPELLEVILN